MSSRSGISISTLTGFAMLVLLAALLALWPAAPAYAQEETPNVAVITDTVDLATTTASITVPVALSVGGNSISSLTFELDYDQTCIRIDDPGADVTGMPSGNGYTHSIVNDSAQGLLKVSIWDADGTQNALVDGNITVIRFALEAACRTNQPDRVILFSFSADPAVTFGDIYGVSVSGASYAGAYTLDINQLPSDIALTRNDENATENVSGERVVGTLAATDATDPSDTHTFALATTCVGTWDNQGFSVSSNNLNTDQTFNYEGVPTYTVCVSANDGQGGIFAKTVTLSVIDANDTPSFITLSSNTIVEGSALATTVGAFSTLDEDTGDSFTYALVAGSGDADNASFVIADDKLNLNTALDYDVKSIYKIRVQTTDSGSATNVQPFNIMVIGKSVLALPGEPNVPYVVAGSTVNVPINFAAMGNDVVTATFGIAYNDTCLVYAGASGLTGLQSGFSSVTTDSDDDGTVNVKIASNTTVLKEGILGYLTFTGDAACDPGQWTELTFAGAPSLQGAGDATLNYSTTNGQVVIVANDMRGDCNSDGARNAGDFSATAREIWDIESTDATAQDLAPNSWLWSPLGSYAGSARGCDSNGDLALVVSDIICTARLYFGATSCGGSVAAATIAPAVVAAPTAVLASAGASVDVPVHLDTQGNHVGALGFTVNVDPAQLVLDDTDADQDGVPDAIILHAPAGIMRMVMVEPSLGKIHVMLSGVVMPMPILDDGMVATIQLSGSAQAMDALTPVTLTNVSLGDTEGSSLPASVVSLAPTSMKADLFLPLVKQ